MAVSDYATFKNLLANAPVSIYGKAYAAQAGMLASGWASAPFAGTAPTTATACSNATTGALSYQVLGLIPSTTKTRRVGYINAKFQNSGVAALSGVFLVDRLSHQGGLSAVVTTAQTTNLPTAALTRYTSGEGVFLGIEIYSQIGGTGTTITVSYTNQAGTAGRTSKAIAFGSTFRNAGAIYIMPLQDGDTGVRSVESVTVLATTGTAGNFGVTLFKVLAVYPATSAAFGQVTGYPEGLTSFLGMGGQSPVIENNACLQLMALPSLTSATIGYEIKVIEDDV